MIYRELDVDSIIEESYASRFWGKPEYWAMIVRDAMELLNEHGTDEKQKEANE